MSLNALTLKKRQSRNAPRMFDCLLSTTILSDLNLLKCLHCCNREEIPHGFTVIFPSQTGSEPPCVEADVYVWRYALLVVHAGKEEQEETKRVRPLSGRSAWKTRGVNWNSELTTTPFTIDVTRSKPLPHTIHKCGTPDRWTEQTSRST